MKCFLDFVPASSGTEIRAKQQRTTSREGERERELVFLILNILFWILPTSTHWSVFTQSTEKSPTFLDHLSQNNKSLYFHLLVLSALMTFSLKRGPLFYQHISLKVLDGCLSRPCCGSVQTYPHCVTSQRLNGSGMSFSVTLSCTICSL